MMSMRDLRIALRKPLADANGFGFVWNPSNIKTSPSAETPFLFESVLAAPVDSAEIGRTEIHSGIYQLDLFTMQHEGDYWLMGKADDIRQAYLSADPLRYNQTQVRVVTVGISESGREDNLWRVRIDINYQSYLEG